MRIPHTRRRTAGLAREEGTALVEFTLVLPLLLVLVFGIADLGRAFNYFTDMTHLAATTARYAVVNNNPGPGATLPDTVALQALEGPLRDGVTICITYPEGTDPGDRVHVAVTYPYTWIPFLGADLPLIGDLPFDGTTTVTAEADMRLERIPTDIPEGCHAPA